MNIVQVSGGELRIPLERGGGSEEYLFNLSKCLHKAGHNVTIIDRKYTPDDPDFEYIGGAKIVRLKARKFSLPNLTINLTLDYISYSRQISKYLRKENFDIIHTHVSVIALCLAIISPGIRKRLFYTSHATRRPRKSKTIIDKMAIALENHLVKLVRKAIVLNEAVRQELLVQTRINPGKIVILPMGTDTNAFSPSIAAGDIAGRYNLDSNKVNVLFVGRIRKDKGLEYLVKAADIVVNASSCKNVQFILVGPTEEFVQDRQGKSPYLATINKLIEEYRLQDTVRLTGSVSGDDLKSFYAISDIFVLPSITEAAPQAIIEAMACGKPVIGTMVGAVPTQIANGQSGFLVNPGNEKQLAEKIKYLVENPDERNRMGAFGRKLAETEYDWSIIADKLLRIYEYNTINSKA